LIKVDLKRIGREGMDSINWAWGEEGGDNWLAVVKTVMNRLFT